MLKALDGYTRLIGIGLVLRVGRAVLQFATFGLLARLLSVQQFGAYAFLIAVIQVVCVAVQFGLPQLVLRDAARLVLEADAKALAALAAWARRVFLITSSLGILLAIISLYLKTPPAVQWFDVCVALLIVPAIGLINLDSSQLRGMRYGATSQISELFVAPAVFFLCVVVLFLGREAFPANVTEVLAVRLIAFLCATLVAHRLLRNAIRRFQLRAPGRSLLPDLSESALTRLKTSMVFGISAAVYALNTNFDVLAIAYISGEEQVALYKVAALVGGAVGLLMQSVNAALGPVISRELALGNPSKLEKLIHAQLRLLSIVVVAVFVFLVLFGEPLLGWAFGTVYGAAYPAMLPLAFASAVSLAYGPAGLLLNMGGHEQKALRASVFSLIINIVLNMLLVPLYGSVGAAVATLLATLVFNFLLWAYAKQLVGVNTLGWLLPGAARNK